MEKRQNRALPVLVGIILIRGFASGGINMTASLFLTPVSQGLGVGIGTLSLYFSIMSVVTILWLPYAGKLVGRYNIRILAVISATLQALSFAGFGLMNNVIGWYLLSIPQAMGAAILVNLLGPILINRWFPHNTGLILGIQMAFVWLFAAGLQSITSQIIAVSGWRNAYFIVGLGTFLVVVASAFLFLRDRPSKEKPEASGKQETPQAVENRDAIEIPEKVATRSASFVLLLIFMTAMTGAAVFTQHIPTYGGLIGYSLSQIGIGMSLSSVGSAVGAIAIGLVSDKIGGLKTCLGIIILWLVAVVGFIFSGTNFVVFAASSFLHGISSSSIAVIAPILTLMFYGKRDYEKIFAKVSMGAPLASILLIPAYGYVYDATTSYLPVLILMIALLCIAGFGILIGWKKRCTAAGCPTWRKTDRLS